MWPQMAPKVFENDEPLHGRPKVWGFGEYEISCVLRFMIGQGRDKTEKGWHWKTCHLWMRLFLDTFRVCGGFAFVMWAKFSGEA